MSDFMYRFLHIFQKSLSGHKNIIRCIDSSITSTGNGVHEVLILMQYCKGKLTLC
jgi:hypothetical protein